MKKVLFAFAAAVLFAAAPALAKEEKEFNNPGYYVTNGMAGAYGFLPTYTAKHFSANAIGGGGFVYYNVVNKIGGNFAIGLSADYSNATFENSVFRAKINITPVALNLAYMTSSDFLNAWAGIALTYTFLDIDIKDGFIAGRGAGGAFGGLSRQSGGVIGGDAFAGAEYIFSPDKRWGVFFEFRFSLTDKIKIDRYIPEQYSNINTKLDFTKYRYTLGISFHF